jgi:SH3-like domain-containing protein
VPPPLVVEPGKGSVTGLPIPRFAALRSNDVNLRVGPGTDRPAEWTYRRRELPVEIVSEFQQWRQIRDMDGTVGWVHSATLTGRRTFVVKAAETMMRRRAEADGAPVARLMPGVVGRIRACAAAAAWCEVQAGEYRGFVLRSAIWGLAADENVGG